MQTFTLDIKRNKYLYLYYLFLHLVCLSWTNTDLVAPSSMLRMAVTFAVFVPLVKYFWMAPAVIILFVGLRFNSVAPFGYIPQSWEIYGIAILLIAFLHMAIYAKKNTLFRFSATQIGLFLFLFLVDLINFHPFTPILLFVLMLYVLYNGITDFRSLNLTMFAFVLLTITLSIYYFVFAQEFVMQYDAASDTERAAWIDPNYFGTVLGCGVIISGAYLFSAIQVKVPITYKIIFIICIVLGFIVIALQASRGAMLAISIALIIQLFFSKSSLYIKMVFIVLSVIGIISLFQSDVFNLLIERIQDDDSSGSGRGLIWASKLTHWSGSIVNLLGTGYAGAVSNFRPYDTDCHNEFISTILNYGIIGLLILVAMIFRLLMLRKNRPFIWSFIAFLMVPLMTLSPFTCQTGWTSCPLLLMAFYKCIDTKAFS